MLTDRLRPTIHELWNLFRSAGVSNPLSAMEQISYLIALKRLEKIDSTDPSPAKLRRQATAKAVYSPWSELKKMKSQSMRLERIQTETFPYLKKVAAFGKAFNLAMIDASFGITQPKLLEEAVKQIDQLRVSDEDLDEQGEIYEELLSRIFFGG